MRPRMFPALLILAGPPGCTGDVEDTGIDSGTDSGEDTDVEPTVYNVRRGRLAEGGFVDLAGLVVTGVSRYGTHCQDPAGGPYAGIFALGEPPIGVNVGDEIRFAGVITEHTDPSSTGSVTLIDTTVDGGLFEVTATAVGEPEAASVSQADLTDPAVAEPWENVFVVVRDVAVADATLPDGQWRLDGGALVDDRLWAFDGGFVAEGARFSAIAGVLWYAADAFHIEPRRGDDFEGYMAPPFDVVTVYDVQGGASPPGTAVRVEAVRVTAIATNGVFVQQAAGGELSGVFVRLAAGVAAGVAVGDEVTVWGVVDEWGDNTVVDARAGLVELTEAGAGELAPAVVASAELGVAATAEAWEGVLVAVEDVTVVDPNAGPGRWRVDDDLLVDDLLHGFDGGFVEAGATFEGIAGVVWTTDGEHAIEPRRPADFAGFQRAPPVGADRLAPGDVIITEILFNPSACPDSVCEWIEVYNTTAAEVDLDRLRLELRSSTGAFRASTQLLGETLVPAGGYAVLAASDGTSADWAWGWLPDASYPRFTLSNTADSILVLANRDGAVDETAPYDSSIDPGAAWQLSATATDAASNDDPASWCPATSPMGSSGDLGTPGATNDDC